MRERDPLAVPVQDACRMLGIGRTLLYSLEDPPLSFRIGRKRLFPIDGLRNWMQKRLDVEKSAGEGE